METVDVSKTKTAEAGRGCQQQGDYDPSLWKKNYNGEKRRLPSGSSADAGPLGNVATGNCSEVMSGVTSLHLSKGHGRFSPLTLAVRDMQ